MQPPAFSIGVAGSTSSRLRTKPKKPQQTPSLRFQSWFLLPLAAPLLIFAILPYGFAAAYREIERLKQHGLHGYSPEFVVHAEECMYKNEAMRWRFKRLARRWLGRKLKVVNTEDLVTCEAPRTCIEIIDWRNRSRYVFEAHTLFRDIRERLLHSSNLFPIPLPPRNPYTNAPLSFGQLLACTAALARAGKSDWTLEALKSVKYEVGIFSTVFNVSLRRFALKRLFSQPAGAECVDLVFDFISDEYEYHGFLFQYPRAWVWTLQHNRNYPTVALWSKLCRKYYWVLQEIPVGDLQASAIAQIHDATHHLVTSPIEGLLLDYRNRTNE